jgi:hypothetical protein
MSLYHFSSFDESNNPQGNDYIIGYIADPGRNGPKEYRITITKLISSFVGGSTQTVYPSSLSPGGPSWSTGGDLTVAGDLNVSGNIGSPAKSVNCYAINLQHGNPNDGVNPNLFIGESFGGSLSGFNTIYDEINNKYVITYQLASNPVVSALAINQTGNVGINTINPNTTLTVSGNISASNISASNISISGNINNPSVAKAWVSFQPGNSSNILKTYGKCKKTSTSSTMTVVITSGHGLSTGMVAQINSLSGGEDGLYSISAIDTNTFQYTSTKTAGISSVCYLSNVVNFTGYNVANVAYPAGGEYAINFATPMNNSNYAIFMNSEAAYTRCLNPIYGISKNQYQFGVSTQNGVATYVDYANVYVSVFGN